VRCCEYKSARRCVGGANEVVLTYWFVICHPFAASLRLPSSRLAMPSSRPVCRPLDHIILLYYYPLVVHQLLASGGPARHRQAKVACCSPRCEAPRSGAMSDCAGAPAFTTRNEQKQGHDLYSLQCPPLAPPAAHPARWPLLRCVRNRVHPTSAYSPNSFLTRFRTESLLGSASEKRDPSAKVRG
jgi:hypothetical protein